MATSRNSSYADKAEDAEKLLKAVQLNAALLGDVEKEKTAVEAALTEAREVSGRQKNAVGERQKSSQELEAILLILAEAVRLLRALIRVRIGSRTEKLVEFGIPPLRLRRRRRSSSTPTPPTVPPTAPGGSTPPPVPTPA
jgi:hypothetical protein